MHDRHHHDHADTLLDDYVMGTLSESDLAWMDAHIPTCAICQAELPLLVDATFALATSVADPPVAMSDDLWSRIEQGLDPAPMPAAAHADVGVTASAGTEPFPPRVLAGEATETQAEPIPQIGPGGRVSLLRSRWLAVAAAVLLLVVAGALIGRLVWPSEGEPAKEIALHDAEGNLIARDVANLEYMPDEQMFVLHMNEMPEAPAGQVYQAWLIAGDVPTPMGIVDPATGEFEVGGDMANYDAFAITMEPGPEGSDLPTSDPIVVAPLDTVS